jgi:hypothetical protein
VTSRGQLAGDGRRRRAGVTRLVHLPNKDFTSYDQAERVAQTGSIVAGLIAFGAPNIDRLSTAPSAVQWPKDNQVRFRDGRPWPESIAGANRDAKGRATGTEAGYTIVNARRIWDADPMHNTTMRIDGSERRRSSRARARVEVVQHRVLGGGSLQDHRHQLRAVRRHGGSDRLARGRKAADILLLDGNPMERDGIYTMLKAKVVIKEGKVLIDKRAPATLPARPAR